MPSVTLLDWDETGLALLRAMNTPDQKRHLGGPETEEKQLDRHARYLTYHLSGDTEMLRIAEAGAIVGSIGYWEIDRNGRAAYETGWELLPAHHGRGLGVAAATALIARLRPLARHRYISPSPRPKIPDPTAFAADLASNGSAPRQWSIRSASFRSTTSGASICQPGTRRPSEAFCCYCAAIHPLGCDADDEEPLPGERSDL